ncbi:MAG: sugar transferase [Acidobacteria bacterium]|nr:sugar transferase [Acidobacteriota bacterium]
MLGASDRPLGASPAASQPPYWVDSSPVVEGWGAFFTNVGSPPLAALALLVLLPLLALVALAVALTSRGPIIHRRRVLGQHGRQFDAFKFRTMVPDADAVLHGDPELLKQFRQTHKLQHDPESARVARPRP